MGDSPGKRLALFRKSLGLSQRDFGAALGVSGGLVGQIEADLAPPSRNFLQRMSERYAVSADWLLHGTGAMQQMQMQGFDGRTGSIVPAESDRPSQGDFQWRGEEFAMIRRMDLDVSAGRGIIAVEGGDAEALAFSRGWLHRHGINADLAVLVRVKGDSMAPSIPDGALVLLHLPEMRVEREGVYAFSRDGESYIKRLVPAAPDGRGRPASIAILSDNPSYPPEVIAGPALNDLRVVGRVRSVLVTLA